MQRNRLEAFSDGVLAIVLTIMVLELKVPHGAELKDLAGLLPVFLSYVLSFCYVGIYWNNHHHMLHTAHRVNGPILWANMHLLFWLSLMPFVTAWMGENHFAPWPTFVYGVDLLMCAMAYFGLQTLIIQDQGPGSLLRRAIGHDAKGWTSLGAYALAIACALLWPWVSQGLFVFLALLWLVPDRRIERALHAEAARAEALAASEAISEGP